MPGKEIALMSGAGRGTGAAAAGKFVRRGFPAVLDYLNPEAGGDSSYINGPVVNMGGGYF